MTTINKVTIMSNVNATIEFATTPAIVSPVSTDHTAVYATVEAAHAVCGSSGQYLVISAKKNNTKGGGVEDGWQVHCVVPSFASGIATLGGWSELVNSVLLKQASEMLKDWRLNNPMGREVPLRFFTADALRDSYMTGSDSVSMNKEELERAFCASATWKRISSSDSFKNNKQYVAIADMFKGKVVSLAGRSHGSITDVELDKILAKLEESDFPTPFGAFVVRKIQQIRKAREEQAGNDIDIDAL